AFCCRATVPPRSAAESTPAAARSPAFAPPSARRPRIRGPVRRPTPRRPGHGPSRPDRRKLHVSAPTARPQPHSRKASSTSVKTPAAGGSLAVGDAVERTVAARHGLAPETVTGARSVVRSLEELGVDTVFGIPGGAILPVYDPVLDSQRVRHVLVRHEQGAGHAATGYAQSSGRVGVCIATSGPGATNLVTPLADAQMDSVPVVAITGQVARFAIGSAAFQEADISGITMPVTKHNFLVRDPADIPRTIAEAFHL